MKELLTRQFLMLWTTIDPIGTLTIFVAVTAGLPGKQRRKVALKAVLYSGAILVLSVVVGQILLTALGIKLISLQVSSGIILFLFGLQMIFGETSSPEKGRDGEHDLAVFPLAVPSIASPGAIMAAIILTDNSLYTVPQQIVTTGLLGAILLIVYLFMLASGPILRVIGSNGAAILIRVMGMILTALSVELVMEALGVARWMQLGG